MENESEVRKGLSSLLDNIIIRATGVFTPPPGYVPPQEEKKPDSEEKKEKPE